MVILRYNKEKSKWDEIDRSERQGGDIYLDGKLRIKLDFCKEQRAKNNDVVGVITGDEGSGKSSLGGNIMEYMADGEFDPKTQMIGSDYDKGIELIQNTPMKGQLMFDEGNVFFLSTEVMKKEQKNLHKLFSIFRQKNLFVLIVMPSYFRLSSYFAMDRSRFMARAYLKKGERSYFAFYGDKKKNKLYRDGKKEHNYNAVKPTFRGRFNQCPKLETKEYKEFKLRTLNDSFTIATKKKQRTEGQIKHDLIKQFIINNPEKKPKEIAGFVGVTERRVYQLKKDISDAISTK